MSDFHFDASLQDFETRVLHASLNTPVLLDFWAEWCAPCKTLKPILEKLADEYQGRFLLAKIDADANPDLARYFGVRSIPTAVMLVGGQPADGFTGERTEAEVRAFIDRFALPPALDHRAKAAALAQVGNWEGALEILLPAIATRPKDQPLDEPLNLDAANALIEVGRLDEAEALLALEYVAEAGRSEALKARIALARNAGDIGDDKPLLEKLAANPDDHDTRLTLSRFLAGQGHYEEALAAALEVVRRDRHYDDGAGRRTLLELFNIIGVAEQNDALVRKYRRALSSLLN
ncbi:co-chaperone YbbN [Betaproteobacteria bacterium]|nr:co-chaperone YbbN [Betaproteobacteria bacterium]GHU47198.1 co-chaperone YbbN [Betaproteobacteria bacterium]